MSNEEKILRLLEQLHEKVDGLESDMCTVKRDVQHIKSDLKGVWSDILRLDNRTLSWRRSGRMDLLPVYPMDFPCV